MGKTPHPPPALIKQEHARELYRLIKRLIENEDDGDRGTPDADGIFFNDCVAVVHLIETIDRQSPVDAEQASNTVFRDPAPALVEALETLLDIFLDGRMDELDDKELAAYQQASKAIDAAR